MTILPETSIPFTAGDGRALRLRRLGLADEAPKGPVMLVHGAGVRSSIFQAPVKENLVQRLVAEGYDVWLEDWRASIDLPPCNWTLDQAALYDHPKAVQKVIEVTGRNQMKAIIHCQGSTSFAMSALAGLVPEVDTIVTNAVSLCPVIPAFSRFKLAFTLPLVHRIMDGLDPQWGEYAPDWKAKLIRAVAVYTHFERENAVSKLVSFTYGSGHPALWRHENLNEATLDWLRREFARVPLSFFEQIRTCVRAGHLVSVDGRPGLPADYAAGPLRTEARWTFLAGELNRCFLPESQVRAHAFFDARQPGRHRLHLFPRYSHLDIFMGQAASEDVFPVILSALQGQG
ncbi:MAG: esterase [Geothrix sp.]|uniref:hypothetical protein n=1 Tax=Geothrix sp. TaxID=1962974 RepID=UPI0017EFC216|nr:hypothetical protein [Geothrix sp.]NWJ41284.1 esterase [Geothrix sp.]WIL20726.1 MAG: hypothetical protein QOZ81_003311 [Geothrix sp.]